VTDTLLKAEPTSKNPEGADVSLMAARWLLRNGRSQDAQKLFLKVQGYGNNFVSQVSLTDQGGLLLASNQPQAAHDLILGTSANPTEIGPLWILAQSYWQMEDWDNAETFLLKIKENRSSADGARELREAAVNRLGTLAQWKTKFFEVPLKTLAAKRDEQGVWHAKLSIHSLKQQMFQVNSVDKGVQGIKMVLQSQKRVTSGVIITVYDLSYGLPGAQKDFKAEVFSLSSQKDSVPIVVNGYEEEEDELRP
jgi:hypothetical protein